MLTLRHTTTLATDKTIPGGLRQDTRESISHNTTSNISGTGDVGTNDPPPKEATYNRAILISGV